MIKKNPVKIKNLAEGDYAIRKYFWFFTLGKIEI